MTSTRHHLTPPGYAAKCERIIFLCGMIGSTLYSFKFFYYLHGLIYQWMYTRQDDGSYLLKRNAQMIDFLMPTLGVDNIFGGFFLTALILLCFIPVRYAYFRQNGSRADYLMHRLPGRLEPHRRCIVVPLIGALICVAAAFALLLLYYGVYHLAVPDGATVVPGQWQRLWDYFLVRYMN